MPISKSFTAPDTGAATEFHIVKSVDINRQNGTCVLQVQSFVNAAGYAAGLRPLWSTPIAMPLTGLGAEDLWLTTNLTSPLSGGSVVAWS